MVWRRPGDKPLPEPMMVRLLTHICVTRPQWVDTNFIVAGGTAGRYKLRCHQWRHAMTTVFSMNSHEFCYRKCQTQTLWAPILVTTYPASNFICNLRCYVQRYPCFMQMHFASSGFVYCLQLSSRLEITPYGVRELYHYWFRYLPKPMLKWIVNWTRKNKRFVKFSFHSTKCITTQRLQNGRHFVQAINVLIYYCLSHVCKHKDNTLFIPD